MFCKKCGKEIEDNSEFCMYCGTKVATKNKKKINKEQAIVESEKTENNIETNNQELSFLQKAKLLEIRIFGLEQAKIEIQKEIDKNSKIISGAYHSHKITKKDYKEYDNPIISNLFDLVLPLSFVLGIISIIESFKALSSLRAEVKGLLFWIVRIFLSLLAGYLVFWIVLLVFTFVLNRIQFFLFLPKIKKKNAKIEEEMKEDEERTKELNENRIKKLEENREALRIIESDLTESKELLKNLYNLGVLYEKYCNIVAVITMCEYMQSGRCHTLQGYTGAYNVYETELRQNIIIGKLANILKSLEAIKQNQFAMYCAIQRGNEIAQNALTEARQNAENMNKLNESVRNTEYNTKQIAENTEIMTYISVFNNCK